MKPLRVLIAGGGTGGHVIPALAIGRELVAEYGAELCFVGTQRGIETKLVPDAGFRLELIHVGQLKNVSLKTKLDTMMDLPRGIQRCKDLLREFQPDVVLGVGGYASGPAMMAALLLRIPTVAYEPNAVPGLANKLVGRFVSAAAVNFSQTTKYFRNAQVTGVPVRKEIFDVPVHHQGPPRLLVFAGSQGARVFNQMLPQIAPALLAAVPGLSIVHQAGARHVESTQAAYEASGADASRWKVCAFLDDMPAQYAAADLVLCRSGSTVAELAAAGRPALLVPFPQAADDHQRKNAEILAKAGAAVMRIEGGLTPDDLSQELIDLLLDPARLDQMSASAKAMAKPGAVEKIAAIVHHLANVHDLAEKNK
jgi:UDP-N-acetylglucosamine--N-acetylmuramyl-(pentapeptide) pyrophosphoryl-undecaprenol N-acetylglucosamine transferase